MKIVMRDDSIFEINIEGITDVNVISRIKHAVKKAYSVGFDSNCDDAYDAGYNDGEYDCDDAYDAGYNDGEQIGYKKGYDIGYDDGNIEGYNTAKDEGV